MLRINGGTRLLISGGEGWGGGDNPPPPTHPFNMPCCGLHCLTRLPKQTPTHLLNWTVLSWKFTRKERINPPFIQTPHPNPTTVYSEHESVNTDHHDHVKIL